MKNTLHAATLLAALMTGTSSLAAPPVVNPEGMEVGADINAKIGMEKAKRNSTTSAMGPGGQGKGGGDCGSVNINSNDSKSNSGIKGMFGKQSTTIVTGPVINMANCK